MSAEPSLTDSPEYSQLYAQLPPGSVAATHLQRLRAARAYQVAADELVSRLLNDSARFVAYPRSVACWDDVGAALGMTKQAASQKHKRWLSARLLS